MNGNRARTDGSSSGRLSRRAALRAAGAVGVAAFLAGQGHDEGLAQSGTPAADTAAYPELVVTAADFSFELPATAPGGFTKLTMKNEGHTDHHAMFMRLNDGADFAELEAAMAQPDLGPIFAVSQSIGGPEVGPGGEASVIADLTPGQYMVICVIPEADGTTHYMMGMYAPLEVTEPVSDAPQPEAQMTVELIDFAFEMPEMAVAAGPQIWEAPNVGQQIHELLVLQLAPGVTYGQVQAMLGLTPATPAADAGAEASPAAMDMSGPPPFKAIGGVAPMNPGYTNWAVLDFTPGEYVAICFVPDPATGAPHFALGMIMPFTVS